MDHDDETPFFSTSSSPQPIDQLYSRDIVLRSPLDPRLFLVRGDAAGGGGGGAHHRCSQHDARLRPKLSALLVGASVLQLKVETTFTAAVLLHRYYATVVQEEAPSASQQQRKQQEDDDEDDWKYVVAVCLFLACKREEEPRRLRDVINVAHMIGCSPTSRQQQQQQGATSANITTATTITWNPTPPPLNASYWTAKQRMVQTEQRVLRWLTLDVAVPHPHRAVVHLLVTYLEHTTNDRNDKDDDDDDDEHNIDTTRQQRQQRFQRLVRASVRRVNDSIFSAAALQQPVLALAVAAVQLAILDEKNKDDEANDNKATKIATTAAALSIGWWTDARYGLDDLTLQCVSVAIQCLQDATESLFAQSL